MRWLQVNVFLEASYSTGNLSQLRASAEESEPQAGLAGTTVGVIDTSSAQAASSSVPCVGHDLWCQLKRVSIPVFSGDKKLYENWKASFMACVDQAPSSAEYKLLQLRQYLGGEALKSIENLGHICESLVGDFEHAAC